ncbi:MAG: hypothetical protein K2H96_09430 [Muribaculaceae bacterium]|nr:hypothetical protein [Muribaculaceae bacterium]
MKKVLLALAGVALAFSANADRYWIHGQIFGNSSWGSVELEYNASTGKYEKTGTIVPGDFGVKVTDDGGSNQTAWYCAQSDATKNITQQGTYPIYLNGKNFSSTLSGNYTISLDWDTKQLSIEPYSGVIEEKISYALHGTIFDGAWNDNNAKTMTEENGVWSWTGNVKAGEFGIKKMTNDTQTGWYWCPTDNIIIDKTGDYSAVLQNGNNGKNWKLNLAGDLTFSFNPETLELKIQGESNPDIDYPAVFLMSSRNGFSESAELKFATEDGITYTLNVPDANSDYEFKIKANGKWFSNGDQEIQDGTFVISTNDETHMSLATGGNVTFTVVNQEDFNSIKVTIAGQEPYEGFAPIFLVSTLTNWTTDDDYMLKTEDGVNYTITVPNWDGDTDFRFFGNDAHKHSFSNGEQNMTDGEYTLNINPNTGAMSTANNANPKDVTFTLVLAEDHSSATLTISGLGEIADDDDYPDMYLVGERTDWAAKSKYKMTTTDGIVYTLNVPDMSNKPFKFFGGKWGTRELVCNKNLMENGEYNLEQLPNVNMTLAKGGNVTFTLTRTSDDWTTATLLVEGQEEGPVEIIYTYALHGQFFTAEKWEDVLMTESLTEPGTYQVIFTPTITGGQFGVKQLLNGNQNAWWNDAVSFGSGEGNVSSAELTPTGDANCTFAYPENVAYIAKFTPTFDGETPGNGLLTITRNSQTGVSEISADSSEAVYFNLQGVKIEKPENGLFIEVRNGHTRKVMVK